MGFLEEVAGGREVSRSVMKFYEEGSLIFLGFGAQVLSDQVQAAHTHYTQYVQFILKSLSLGIHPCALCGAFGSRLPNIFWHFNPGGTLELLWWFHGYSPGF